MQTIASTLVQTWASLALSTSNNLLLAYGTTGTSTLGYNLFADRWLATNIVSTEVCSIYVPSRTYLLTIHYLFEGVQCSNGVVRQLTQRGQH